MAAYDWATKALDTEPLEEADIETAMKFYRLFRQNPEGKALLDHWLKAFVFSSTPPGLSMFELGMKEGQATLVKAIVHQIQKVENKP